MEDGGGSGTAGSHWEKRIFGNDYMTGVRDSNGAVITALSVALLGDTGWYVANYAAVQPLVWGFARGCAFVQGSCSCPTASSSCTWTQYEYSCTSAVRQVCQYCNNICAIAHNLCRRATLTAQPSHCARLESIASRFPSSIATWAVSSQVRLCLAVVEPSLSAVCRGRESDC